MIQLLKIKLAYYTYKHKRKARYNRVRYAILLSCTVKHWNICKTFCSNIKWIEKFVNFEIMFRCNLYICKDKNILQFENYIKISFGIDALITLCIEHFKSTDLSYEQVCDSFWIISGACTCLIGTSRYVIISRFSLRILAQIR